MDIIILSFGVTGLAKTTGSFKISGFWISSETFTVSCGPTVPETATCYSKGKNDNVHADEIKVPAGPKMRYQTCLMVQ
jgi:hypothetical protein